AAYGPAPQTRKTSARSLPLFPSAPDRTPDKSHLQAPLHSWLETKRPGSLLSNKNPPAWVRVCSTCEYPGPVRPFGPAILPGSLPPCKPPSPHPDNLSAAKRKSRIDNPPGRCPNLRHHASARPARPHRLPGMDSLSSQSATPNTFSDFPEP